MKKIDLLRESIRKILIESESDELKLSALVIGDSQSEGALGKSAVRALTDLGFFVKRNSKTGAPGSVVAKNLQTELSSGKFDLIIAFFGGNDSSVATASKAASEIISLAEGHGAYLVLIGPPPATRITNLKTARSVFGDNVGNDENYHLKRDGGNYPERRRSIAQEIERSSTGSSYRKVFAYGIAAHPELEYPDQPDGIHCQVDAEKILNTIFQEIGFSNIIEKMSR